MAHPNRDPGTFVGVLTLHYCRRLAALPSGGQGASLVYAAQSWNRSDIWHSSTPDDLLLYFVSLGTFVEKW